MTVGRPPGPAERISIALIHYAAPPVVGGVERVLGRQAALMADAGHAVRLVAGRGASPDPRVRFVAIPRIDPRHPAVERVQADLDRGRVPPEFYELAAALGGALEEALAGVDVVIAHNVCSLSLNLALTAALRGVAERRAPPRLILWHHDLAWTSPRYRPTLHEGRPWDLLRDPWPGAAQVVVSAARQRELAALTGVPAASIAVVPNGVDLASTWKLEPRSSELLARMDLTGVAPLLLVPARITARKNIELALHVVAAMRAAGRGAGLLVTGPVDPHRPAEQGYLERLLDLRRTLGLDAVAWFLATELPGTPSDAVVNDLYRVADALFLPSWDEGFGLPILEAAVNRLPVFCADLPSLREIAGDAALYLSAGDDPAAIARQVLERLEADEVLRFSRRIRSDYAWEAIYRTRIAPLLLAG